MVLAETFASQAVHGGYIGIPYSTLDCQAFVEKVLAAAGVRDENGKRYNWLGSNDMWRHAVYNRLTVAECMAQYGSIPIGAWLFTIKHDGNEPARYTDGVNAAHVGIYVGAMGTKPALHSTTGGVQWADCPASRWTHIALCKYLDYRLNTTSTVLWGGGDESVNASHIRVTWTDSDGTEQEKLLELADGETINVTSIAAEDRTAADRVET